MPVNIKNRLKKRIRSWHIGTAALVLTAAIWFWFSLPRPLFDVPLSTVLYDRSGNLISAHIATDGQWRFPEPDSLSEKFVQCILYFEDEYFYHHPGINPVSMGKALYQNIRAGSIVRGGSTLTLQVIRMARDNKKRTVGAKLIECFMALRLELGATKGEILSLYATNAPFGSNVVGLEAASWRYFGRPSSRLSWGETATLAVLPNAPSLIYPGRNHDQLLAKRNRLLDKLLEHHVIDTLTCQLARLEPIPGQPAPLPQLAYHLLGRAMKDGHEGEILNTTLEGDIQQACLRIASGHHQLLSANEVHHLAILVLEVETGNVLAYVGNVDDLSVKENSGNHVDIINAPRSSGSILKPFLYASMLKEGLILPGTLIPDIPTQISGYSPLNFDRKFDGAVPAGNALARSLNVPAVRMLQQYGVDKFLHQLDALHFTTVTRSADNYGLSLILGGAEITLWDLAGAYASMARVLNHFAVNSARYTPADHHDAFYLAGEDLTRATVLKEYDILGAAASWETFEALTEMDRPEEGTGWRQYASSRKIAWKTGTSYGYRDAWAVGVTPGYVVAVWAGNADGEGRPGLTGASAAAPVMFDVYRNLPVTGWFEPPYDDMVKVPVCTKSGYLASTLCDEVDTLYVPKAGLNSAVCPYHKLVHLDKSGTYQVTGSCYPVVDMVTRPWFVLPAAMEWYYKSRDVFYKPLPPFMKGCTSAEEENMALLYPEPGTIIFIPRGFGGSLEKVVFEAVHKQAGASVFWHLDQDFLGTTALIHQMEVFASEGPHVLTLVDERGETLTCPFEVVSR